MAGIKKIGLFPLKMVLLPESIIPLHIYEDRYKRLINECSESKSEFGINFNDTFKLYEIGCTAKIFDIIKRYDDGRLDITIQGIRKYKLKKFGEGEAPYYTGEIIIIEDDIEQVDYKLLQECIDEYNQIIGLLKDIRLNELDMEQLKSFIPSYYIAQKSGMSLIQRQSLLEMTSENMRLEFIYLHLKKMLPIAKETEIVSRIIKNDGYMRN